MNLKRFWLKFFSRISFILDKIKEFLDELLFYCRVQNVNKHLDGLQNIISRNLMRFFFTMMSGKEDKR